MLKDEIDSKPLISVICLCFNHEKYVIAALESIISQEYSNIEIILVDDYSTDNSRKVIEIWNTNNTLKKIIFNEKNLGITKSFNNALKYVTGEYVIDLAADDMLAPCALKNHIENFKKNNNQIGVSFGNVETIDEKDTHISYQYPINSKGKAIVPPKQGNVYANVLERYFISSPSIMSHIDVHNKLNGYDPNLIFEDFDFLVRSSRLFPFFYSDHILIKKRTLSTSLSKSIKKRNKSSFLHRKAFFKIYKKAIKLNETKAENTALIKRLRRELKICLKLCFFNYFILAGILLLTCAIKHFSYKN